MHLKAMGLGKRVPHSSLEEMSMYVVAGTVGEVLLGKSKWKRQS